MAKTGNRGIVSVLASAMVAGIALIPVLFLGACADETNAPKDPEDHASAASPSSEEATADEALGTVSSDAVSLTSGCASVNFCDNPSSSIGTDCRQTGCSLSSAESECLTDTTIGLGCNLHFPVVLRNSSGTIIAKKLSCGGSSCPWGSPNVYCGPKGACCDGIHFSSACPPL